MTTTKRLLFLALLMTTACGPTLIPPDPDGAQPRMDARDDVAMPDTSMPDVVMPHDDVQALDRAIPDTSMRDVAPDDVPLPQPDVQPRDSAVTDVPIAADAGPPPGPCAITDSVPCYTGPAGTAGVGTCRAGQYICTPAGTWYPTCLGESLPRTETCNNMDDDCDGVVDDADANPSCPPDSRGMQLCTAGMCSSGCLGGMHMCSGRCVADDDPTACGTACTPCVAPTGGVAVCRSGACDFRCHTGFVREGRGCVPSMGTFRDGAEIPDRSISFAMTPAVHALEFVLLLSPTERFPARSARMRPAVGYAYELETDTWTSIAMPRELDHVANAAVVSMNEDVYVLGGEDRSVSPPRLLDSLWHYNTSTRTWTRRAAMPGARTALTVASTGFTVIALGGLPASSTESTTWEYDPLTDAWSTLPSGGLAGTPHATDRDIATSTDDGVLWYRPSTGNGAMFNRITRTWQRFSGGPARTGVAWARTMFPSTFVVWGGRNVSDGALSNEGSAYMIASDTWARVGAGAATPRCGAIGGWAGRGVMFYGGGDCTTSVFGADTGFQVFFDGITPTQTLGPTMVPGGEDRRRLYGTMVQTGDGVAIFGGGSFRPLLWSSE